jgi:hypothetical protein
MEKSLIIFILNLIVNLMEIIKSGICERNGYKRRGSGCDVRVG